MENGGRYENLLAAPRRRGVTLAELLTTPLRRYYDALCALEEADQTILAEGHAREPGPLVRRFLRSVKTSESHELPAHEDFYPNPDEREDPRDHKPPPDEIGSTIEFAAHVIDGEHAVAGGDGLTFGYVDREIFPARAKSPGLPRMAPRTLDLLLIGTGGLPIVGELKIEADSLTYFAFVQALMHAAELVTTSQRKRLADRYPDAGFASPADGPFIDIYVIALRPPATGRYRQRSFDATKELSKRLVTDPNFGRYIRRIAYLIAEPEQDALAFHAEFAFSGP